MISRSIRGFRDLELPELTRVTVGSPLKLNELINSFHYGEKFHFHVWLSTFRSVHIILYLNIINYPEECLKTEDFIR